MSDSIPTAAAAHSTPASVPVSPIAIVGMACRFPAAENTNAYWRLIQDGRDAITEVPPDRWDVDAYYDPKPGTVGKMCTRWGGFLKRGVDRFDASLFKISPREANWIDPQQRLILEQGWLALEDALLAPDRLAGSRTGVFVGVSTDDYGVCLVRDYQSLNEYTGTGGSSSIVANRLSYALDLQGPSIAMDTACSSSLTSVHLGCQSLRTGECDLALCGGVNVILTPDKAIAYSQSHMMALDGRCKPFDARADGFVRGEGCGMVVLKRLEDAERDGDLIRAVILGSAVNQDGRSNGLTAPQPASQRRVIEAALRSANLEPRDVGYVEAHGTGTALGDPIELNALVSVLSRDRAAGDRCVIGSVKSNIGHLEAAAGVASLVKVVRALETRSLPGQLHFQKLNPRIALDPERFAIGIESQTWATDRRRIAGINGFGFGGANAHLVVGEYLAGERSVSSSEGGLARSVEVLRLSAHEPSALPELASQYAALVSAQPDDSLGDVCYSALVGRSALPFVATVVAESKASFASGLEANVSGQSAPNVITGKVSRAPKKLGFLFTGQGSQRIGMGRDLYESEPCFREWMDRGRESLERLPSAFPESVWNPLETIDETTVRSTAWAQPALYVLEVALWEQWCSWGIRPTALLGHSVGEYAAAYAAGVFGYEEGLRLIEARGRLTQALPAGGGMVAVSASLDEVVEALSSEGGAISIAAINGPQQVAVSGSLEALELVVTRFRERGHRVVPMNVSHAFHSPLLEPMLDAFQAVAETISFRDPQLPLISNVSGEPVQPGEISAAYWRAHALAPVQFVKGVASLESLGCQGFLELGPQSVLTGLGRRCAASSGLGWLASLKRDGRDSLHMLTALGRLDQWGHRVDWMAVYPPTRYRKRRLPEYAFQRKRFWFDESGRPEKSVDAGRLETVLSPVEFPGRRVAVAGRSEVRTEMRVPSEVPDYLLDHRVGGESVWPAAAWIDAALVLAERSGFTGPWVLEDFSIARPLPLNGDSVKRVQCLLAGGQFEGYGERLGGDSDESVWDALVSGRVASQDMRPELLPFNTESPMEPLGTTDLYEIFEALGLEYGKAFRPLVEVRRGNECAWGRVRLPEGLRPEGVVHPVLLDGAFQVLGAIESESESESAWVPVGIERFWIAEPLRGEVEVRAYLPSVEKQTGERVASIDLLDSEGRLLAQVTNLRLRRMPRSRVSDRSGAIDQEWVYDVEWRPKEISVGVADSGASRGASALVIGDDSESLRQCGAALAALGYEYRDVLLPSRDDDLDWLRRLESESQALADLDALTLVFSIGDTRCGEGDLMERLRLRTRQFRQFIQFAIGRPRAFSMVLVTGKVQRIYGVADGGDPIGSALWAMARCVGLEQRHGSCRCVDRDLRGGDGEWRRVAQEIGGQDDESQIALRQGRRYVPRLVSAGSDNVVSGTGQIRLRQAGDLESLHWAELERREPRDNEVEIEVVASGLNFRDVLHALGQLKMEAASRGVQGVENTPFGFECSGRVVRVGAGVTRWKAGDAVVAVGMGCLASYVIVTEASVAPKPCGWTWEAAAAVPVAFLTAWHALVDLAQVRPGERVLIHSIAGGVGQAALQITSLLGAIPIGTASAGKRAFVAGQEVACVVDSRDPAFAEAVLTATEQTGVDVVLNSFSGAMLDATIRCVRPGGRFVEIGKRDILSREDFAERRPDVVYHVFDLSEMVEGQPGAITALFHSLERAVADGFCPLPLTSFPMAEAARGFRFLGQARQVGKVVMRTQAEAELTIRDEVSYLITGGLGALGLATAEAMASRGARSIVLLGRSGPNEAAQTRLQSLVGGGIEVKTVSVDVGDLAALRLALEHLAKEVSPIRGVVHAAGSLRDGMLKDLTDEDFDSVFHAKALGAWNLHLATQDLELDFFVHYSSIASRFGSPGQANYAAANGFLDGLAGLRSRAQQPILNLNWGPWEGTGMAARMHAAASPGLTKLGTDRGTRLLMDRGAALGDSVIPVRVDWSAFRAPRGMEGFFEAQLMTDSKVSSQAGEGIRTEWKAASEAERSGVLLHYLQREVASVLGLKSQADSIDAQMSLLNLGADSLLMMELAGRVERVFEITLPQSELSPEMSLDDLATVLRTLLGAESVSTKSEPQPKAPALQEAIPKIDFSPPILTLKLQRRLTRFGKLSRRLWQLETEGLENLPSQGPVIFCANHESHFDGLWIASVLPTAYREQLCILAKQEHFEHGLNRRLAELIGAIGIDRDASATEALAKGWAVLRQGKSLIVHPEGTRTRDGEMLPFRAGAAVLALTAQVPMIPVCLTGAFEVFPAGRWLPSLWKGNPVRIRFGAPVSCDADTNASAATLMNQVRERIVALRPTGESVDPVNQT